MKLDHTVACFLLLHNRYPYSSGSALRTSEDKEAVSSQVSVSFCSGCVEGAFEAGDTERALGAFGAGETAVTHPGSLDMRSSGGVL